jgi:hypothetical protein
VEQGAGVETSVHRRKQKAESRNLKVEIRPQAGIHPLGGLEPLHRYKLDSIDGFALCSRYIAATQPLHDQNN